MKVNTLFLPYSQNSCFVFPGTTLAMRNSNVMWRRRERPPSAMRANRLLHPVQVVTRVWSERKTWENGLTLPPLTSCCPFLRIIVSSLQPVHVFSYKAFCPLRLFASLLLVRLFSSTANVKAVSGHFGYICLHSIWNLPLCSAAANVWSQRLECILTPHVVL